ncbi:MYCBP-associated protein-like isoform X2 [Gasterosteus aculeatus]
MQKTSEEDIQTPAIPPQDLNKIHIPKPPKGRQKAALRACVRKMQPADGGHVLRGPVAHPVNPAPNSQLLDYTVSYLEAKEKTELVKHIPKSRTHYQSEAPGSHPSEAVESGHGIPSGPRNIQCNALQNLAAEMCQSIVDEVLWMVRTPERPCTPAELGVNEEQEFLSQNPKLQYLRQPVEDLKRLWQDWQPERPWDLSVHTLRQVVLSPHGQESAQEESLAQLNSLLLQLCEPRQRNHHKITAADIGQQLWAKLLDTMDAEATRLRDLLGLPVKDIWMEKNEKPLISGAGETRRLPIGHRRVESQVAENKDEKSEKKGEAAAEVEIIGIKRESQSALTEESVEDSEKKGDRKKEAGERPQKKQGKETASLTDILPDNVSQQPPDVELMDVYTRQLHKKVYVLMEDLVENLCDVMDDLNERDEQDRHY